MTDAMKIDFNWLGRETGDPVERATFAALSVFVDGQPISEVEDRSAKTVRNDVRASAYHLAEWLAANWWRLRWEPEDQTLDWKLSHQLASAAGGYAWPDITFSSDGEDVLVESKASASEEVQPVRYLRDYSAIIPVQQFVRAIDEFVEAVIERLYACEIREYPLLELWREIKDERNDAESAASRKLEALMGFDPDASPDNLVDLIQKLIPEFGQSAIEEIAASERVNTQGTLRGLSEVGRKQAVQLQIPALKGLQGRVREGIASGSKPWERARDTAHSAREEWGLGLAPLSNHELSDLFSIPREVLEDRQGVNALPEMAAGFRNGAADRLDVVLDKQRSTGRRFSFARLLGDHLRVGSAERLLPATRCKTARQKFQRAFAQEFLCPFEALDEFSRKGRFGDDEVDAAANHFEVSPLLVRTTLVNRGVFDRGALTD